MCACRQQRADCRCLAGRKTLTSRLLTTCRSKIKTRLETAYGEWVERIPAWIKWATQDPNEVPGGTSCA